MFIAYFVIVTSVKNYLTVRIWRNKFKRMSRPTYMSGYGKSVKVVLSIRASYDGIFRMTLFYKIKVYI